MTETKLDKTPAEKFDKSKVKTKKKSPKKTFKKPIKKPLYSLKSWKGVREVYKCAKCEHCEEDEDEMKLHVLKHFPKKEREKQLDILMR